MTYTEMLNRIDDYLELASSNNYSQAKKTRDLNDGYDYIVSVINNNVDSTGWDDPNWGDLAIGYVDIVAGKKEYEVWRDENNASIFSIQHVARKNSGDYIPLDRVSIHEMPYIGQEDQDGDSYMYYYQGPYLVLTHTPTKSVEKGLKFHFSRSQRRFTVYDDGLEPGFNSLFHRLLPIYASMRYAISRGLSVGPSLKTLFDEGLSQMITHYRDTNEDDAIIIQPAYGTFQ